MHRSPTLWRRLRAAALAAATLWAASVTAGSDTAASAARALCQALPLRALRWELGDLGRGDRLSPAAAMTLGESPLLLAARPAVAELRRQEESAPESPREEGVTTVPVEETPLEAPQAADNGVPARTLVPTDPSGYTVAGRAYITNSTDYSLAPPDLLEPFAAQLTPEEPQVLILHTTDPSGYTVAGRAYITNSTDYSLAPPDLLEPFAAQLTPEEPQVLILHTHGSEAYTPAPGTEVVWSGNHRTTDSRYNVVAVGDAMAEVLGEAGISVIHDRTLYDYPSYSGAYDRSLAAIQSYLAQYPTIRFILDVHRDAIEDGQGNQYKVVSAIEGEGTAAQLTLVVGSDGSGLTHPHWKENLRLAVAVQQDALACYPTLMRPILLRNSRYNQHATTGSLLIEAGAAGNSPEEAALAGRLFAQRMAEVLQAQSK